MYLSWGLSDVPRMPHNRDSQTHSFLFLWSHEENWEPKAGAASPEQPLKPHTPSSFSAPEPLDFGFLLHNLKKYLYSEWKNRGRTGQKAKDTERSIPLKT